MNTKSSYARTVHQFAGAAIVAGSLLTTPVFAIPLDRETSHVNLDLSSFQDFAIFGDSQDVHTYYVAPNQGGLVRNNGMPALSYAHAVRDNQKFAILNAVFQFGVNNERFDKLKESIKSQDPQAKIAPLPIAQTTPTVAVAGVGDQTCFDALDIITGKTAKQCIGLTHKVLVAQHGPTLGEQLATSMILSPAGVEIFPKLLAGGSGVMVNLEYVYRATLPTFKATIDADYKKLYESYATYAGYHDGICTDIAVSDFFEKEVACKNNETNAFGKACSIVVEYTDSQGKKWNNMFDVLPITNEDADTKAWYKAHADRVNTLWTSIEGLRKDFETKFLEPVNGRRAEVDKKPTLGFALRADRSRTEKMGTYHFERDMLGSVGPKRSVIPAYTTCIKVDGETGLVDNSNLGRCTQYYNGEVTAAQLTPVVPAFTQPGNNTGNRGIGPVDWSL